jgi:hypothetical protein
LTLPLRALAVACGLALCGCGFWPGPRPGRAVWARSFSTQAGGATEAHAVAADSAGNLFVAALFRGTTDLGRGPMRSAEALGYADQDLALAKLDPSGRTLWVKQVAHATGAEALAADAGGGVLVTGSVRGDVDFGGGLQTGPSGLDTLFVAKYDSAGRHVFSRRFEGGNHVLGTGLGAMPRGDFVVAGILSGSVDFGGGLVKKGCCGYDLLVAGFDAAGRHRFSLSSGSEGYAGLQPRVAATPDGGAVVVANFQGPVDFGGFHAPAPGPAPEPQTRFERHFGGAEAHHLLAVRLDAAGRPLWSKSLGGQAEQTLAAVAVDPSGSVLLFGESTGAIDFGGGALRGSGHAFVLAKLDLEGRQLWAKRFSGHKLLLRARQHARCLAAGPHGEIAIAGRADGRVSFDGGKLDGSGDTFVAVMDGNGRHRFSKTFEAGVNAYVQAIAFDPAGRLAAVGQFTQSVDFGGARLTGAPEIRDSEGFVVVLAP